MDQDTGEPLVPFTTFSIAMINRMSGGQLQTFVDGLAALETLKEVPHPRRLFCPSSYSHDIKTKAQLSLICYACYEIFIMAEVPPQ
jgi:hypothetical protein